MTSRSTVPEQKKNETDFVYPEWILDSLYCAIISTDENWNIVSWNFAAEKIYGWSVDEVIGKQFLEIMKTEGPGKNRGKMVNSLMKNGYFTGEVVQSRKDGKRIIVETRAFALHESNMKRKGFITVSQDISEKKLTDEILHANEARMKLAEARYQALVQYQIDLIFRISPGGSLLFVNKAACNFFKKSTDELMGHDFQSLIYSGDQGLFFNAYPSITPEDPVATCNTRVPYPEDQVGLMDWTIIGIFDDQNQLVEYQVIGHNITDIKGDSKLESGSPHDSLTGLPNRILLIDRLEHAVSHAHRFSHRVALVILDMDHFNDLNNEFGHARGDEVLRIISSRLQQCIRKSDSVARIGGDEFGIVLEGVQDREDCAKVINRIMQRFLSPVLLQGKEIYLTSSIGISIFPEDGDDVSSLLDNADIAQKRAKEKRNTFFFFQ